MKIRAVLEDIATQLSSLSRLPWGDGSSVELVATATAVQRVRNLLAAFETALVSQLELCRTAGDYCRQTTAELLVQSQLISPAQARVTVDRARTLGPQITLQGEVLPPLLPSAADASASGALSAEQAAVIIECADAVPAGAGPHALDVVQSVLIEAAEHEHPKALRRTAAMLLARLDEDGPEPDDRAERRRGLSITPRADGSARITGDLTCEVAALWRTVLDTLGAPRPAQDGESDPRSAGQRRHDGFAEAGRRLLRSGDLPAAGGVPVTVLVRTTVEDLRNGRGVALTADGDAWPVRDLLTSCSDAELVPVLVDRAGAVLALGRCQRLATRSQRLALAARDGGCSFPGCDRPPAWTEVHHVIPWIPRRPGDRPGPTDLDNLTLVCRYHHREFERRGWQVRMRGGLPEWVPPAWLDPEQAPRRNRTHHRPDIHFEQVSHGRPVTVVHVDAA